MDEVIYKVASGFKVTWDINSILTKFSNDLTLAGSRTPLSNPNGSPHWQHYKSNISFARNFVINFLNEAKEVANSLSELQQSILNTNIEKNFLLEKFINHKIDFKRVNLIRISSDHDVDLHCDTTRGFAINIGFMNSNTHRTFVSHDENINNFETSKKSDYVLDDGDAYIIAVKYPHCVKSLNKNSKLTRYIITYNIEIYE